MKNEFKDLVKIIKTDDNNTRIYYDYFFFN